MKPVHAPPQGGQPGRPSRGRSTRIVVPPPEFVDHDLDYLRAHPRAAQITPLGPNPLRVRLVLNTLVHKWVDHVAGLYPYSLDFDGRRAQRGVIKLAILAGLPVLEARSADALSTALHDANDAAVDAVRSRRKRTLSRAELKDRLPDALDRIAGLLDAARRGLGPTLRPKPDAKDEPPPSEPPA